MCDVFVARPGGPFEKIKQPNTIFISGLPVDVTPDQLKDHFGGIGRIKVCEVNYLTHRFYGRCTIFALFSRIY